MQSYLALRSLNADLSKANLERANLSDASFHRANLRGANLMGAEMYDTTISFADSTQANLKNAKFFQVGLKSHDQGTIFEDTVMPDGAIETRSWV